MRRIVLAIGLCAAPAFADSPPTGSVCTGHWTAKLTKSCPLVQNPDLDVTIGADANDFTVAVGWPSNAAHVELASIRWSRSSGTCDASFIYEADGQSAYVTLSRLAGSARAEWSVRDGTGEICNAQDDEIRIRIEPTNVKMPPPLVPPGELAIDVGPWSGDCPGKGAHFPPGRQAFTLSVDRTEGDKMSIVGLDGWMVDPNFIRLTHTLVIDWRDHRVREELTITGTTVTGTAIYDIDRWPDPVCATAPITGTFAPAH